MPVDQGAGMTTNEVLQVVDSMPPGPEGMIVAVPGSVGALEPDAIDTTTLLSQVNLWFSHFWGHWGHPKEADGSKIGNLGMKLSFLNSYPFLTDSSLIVKPQFQKIWYKILSFGKIPTYFLLAKPANTVWTFWSAQNCSLSSSRLMD